MTLGLKPVTRADVGPLIRMKVRDEQTAFVAPNAATLAQVAYEPNAEVFVLLVGDARAGLMAVIDTRGYPHLEDGDDPDSGFLWRLMIDPAHQGCGLGKAAMDLLAGWARGKGLNRLYTSAVPQNETALGLYESVGFVRTGRIIDDEIELRRSL